MCVFITHLTCNKFLLGGLVAAIVLVLVGIAAVYAMMSRTVTVSVDGKEFEVRIFGDNVGEVLVSKGIKPIFYDFVVLGVDVAVNDGFCIAVCIGRLLALSVDGVKRTVWTTVIKVSTALEQVGVRFGGAVFSVSCSVDIDRFGMSLSVIILKKVALKVANDKVEKHNVLVIIVRDLLFQVDAGVDRNDIVCFLRSAKLTDGICVVVTKIGTCIKRVPREVIFVFVTECKDDSMMEGETETVREGSNGVRDVIYKVRFRNGEVVKRFIVKQRVISEPVAKIVKIGIKTTSEVFAVFVAANFASGGIVWDQIVQCESGGNWVANIGNGYYGGLQFNFGIWSSYGGSGMSHENSCEQQIVVVERVAAAEGGYGVWLHCGVQFG